MASKLQRIAIDTPPGIVKRSTPYWAAGRYVDSDKVRFRDGLPEKEGGCVRLRPELLDGACRGLHSYIASNGTRYLAMGTHTKLYNLYGGVLDDITPIRASDTLTDPFATTSGSRTVTVADTTHGLDTGARAIFTDGDPVGGIYIQGEYEVTVIDADSYTIEHGAAASSTTTGGGSVDVDYLINPGLRHNIDGIGYGVGPCGLETYGTPRTASIMQLICRTWQIDHRDDDLIACHYRGRIYKWNPADQRATVLANSPVDCVTAFVTDEGHVVALGPDDRPLDVDWSDADDPTAWTPALDNEAGSRTLQGSGRLVAGMKLARGLYMLWSDADVYLMRYVPESNVVFDIERLGSGYGIAGPNAAIALNGIPYWMAPDGAVYRYAGQIERIDDGDIAEFVSGTTRTPALNARQMRKVYAFRNVDMEEVGFLFPSIDSIELDRLARYSPNGGYWTPSLWDRTAWLDAHEFGYPVAVDPDGRVYRHETGVDNDGEPLRSYLVRAPDEVGDGTDLLNIIGIVPDFHEQRGTLTLILLATEEPRDEPVEERLAVGPGTKTVDARSSGRQVGFRIESDELGGFFRMGKIKLLVQAGGMR